MLIILLTEPLNGSVGVEGTGSTIVGKGRTDRMIDTENNGSGQKFRPKLQNYKRQVSFSL